MKKFNPTRNFILLALFLFVNSSFAQFHYFYKGNSQNVIKSFKYNNIYYDASPKGLKKFIDDTKMPMDVKNSLTKQLKSIKSKKTISDIALYGGGVAGSAIFLNEMITLEDGQQLKSSALFAGLGVFALGGVINAIVRPKKKDYLEFVNTFNRDVNKKSIDIGLKMDYSEQLNFGIVFTF